MQLLSFRKQQQIMYAVTFSLIRSCIFIVIQYISRLAVIEVYKNGVDEGGGGVYDNIKSNRQWCPNSMQYQLLRSGRTRLDLPNYFVFYPNLTEKNQNTVNNYSPYYILMKVSIPIEIFTSRYSIIIRAQFSLAFEFGAEKVPRFVSKS